MGGGAEEGGGDAQLIADCAAFEAAYSRERAAAAGTSPGEADRLADATDAAFRRIPGTAPSTPAGLRAKAAAAMVRLLWRAAPLSGVPWRDQVSDGERAALECLAAVCGRPLP